MIFLSAIAPCTISVYGAEFTLAPVDPARVNPAHILVMEDELGKRVLNEAWKKIRRIRFDADLLPGFPKPLPAYGEIPADSRIVIIRGGGIGDVLMCTPALREMRKRLGKAVQLKLATFEINADLFKGNTDLDGVLPLPLTLRDLLQADYVFEFKDPDSLIDSMHMIDFYLKGAGFKPDGVSAKKPLLNAEPLLDPDLFSDLNRMRNGFKHLVYLNGVASDPLRDIPPEVLGLLPQHFGESLFLVPQGYDERLREKGLDLPEGKNIRSFDSRGSMAAYVTALDACDLLVTADTSAYHIAAALEKPALALFGPISSGLRTTYYPSVLALDASYSGKTCRAPCGKSMYSEFYEGDTNGEKRCPEAVCRGSRFSPCLSAFGPETLYNTFERLLKKAGAGHG